MLGARVGDEDGERRTHDADWATRGMCARSLPAELRAQLVTDLRLTDRPS